MKRSPALPEVTVSNVVVGLQSISFHVSRVGVPVLVKISYFPRWQAKGATDADFAKYGIVTEYRTYVFEIAKNWKPADGQKWFLASNWSDREANLFALAAEVARKLGR